MFILLCTLAAILLYLYFIYLCIMGTVLIRRQAGLLPAIVFIAGVMSIPGWKNDHKDAVTMERFERHHSKPDSGYVVLPMREIVLEKGLTYSLVLYYSLAKDTVCNEVFPVVAWSSNTGFLGTSRWLPYIVNLVPRFSPGREIRYSVTGSLETNIYPLYHHVQLKEFEGSIYLQDESVSADFFLQARQ